MLEEVKGRRRFTWILLSQNAQVADVRDGVLVLAMAGIGPRDSFAKGGSENILREALNDALGVDLRIETIVDPSVSSSGRGGPGPGGGASAPAADDRPAAPASTLAPEASAPAWQASAPAPAEPSPPSDSHAHAPDSRKSGDSQQRDAPSETVDPRWREQARQGIRPTRQGGVGASGEVEDLRDEAVSVYDSNVEELEESHTELLARQLGAEIIGEEPHEV